MNNKELRMCLRFIAYVRLRMCVCVCAYMRIRCVYDGRLFLSGTVLVLYASATSPLSWRGLCTRRRWLWRHIWVDCSKGNIKSVQTNEHFKFLLHVYERYPLSFFMLYSKHVQGPPACTVGRGMKGGVGEKLKCHKKAGTT